MTLRPSSLLYIVTGSLAGLALGCGSGAARSGAPAETPDVADVAPDTGSAESPELPAVDPCDGLGVSISPVGPVTLDTLTAVVEGGAGSFGFRWFSLQNGTPSWIADGATLISTKTRKGIVYRVEAEALDGGGCMGLSAEISVGNSPPSVSQVQITPSAAYAGQTLTCGFLPGAWADPDDTDPKIPKVVWLRGDAIIGGQTDVTISTGFAKGDAVRCRLTPSDGEADGAPVDSPPVPILNGPPELSGVVVACEGGAPVSCTGTASDPDGTVARYEIDWMMGAGGCASAELLQDGAIGEPGHNVSVLTAEAPKGAKVFCCVTPVDGDDETVRGAQSKGDDCLVPNQPPTVTAAFVVGKDGPLVHGAVAQCKAEAADPDGDPVSLACAWQLNGEPVGGAACELGGGLKKGDSLCCQLTATDGIIEVVSEAKACQTVGDTPPVVSSVTLQPADGSHCAPFVCQAVTADADADEVLATVSWSVDGQPFAGVPTPAPGQEVTCTVTPVADGLAGEPVSAMVLAKNQLPAAQGAVVSSDQEPPSATATLTCTPVGWSDADLCDEASWQWQWFVNGEEVLAETAAVLSPGAFSKQTVVSCVATPGDGFEWGSPVPSGVLVIQNSPPAVSKVTVSPVVGKDSTLFTCQIEGGDPDGDDVSWVYQWFVNGALAPGLVGAEVSGIPFDGVDAELTCSAQPFDAESAGEAMASGNKALLFNVPPVVVNVTLGPEDPSTLDTLSCAGEVSDPDGESATPIYTWYRILPDGAAVIEGAETAFLAPELTSHFDTIYCEIRPDDGKVQGAPKISNTVTVQNAVPEVQSVTVVPSAATPQTPLACAVVGYFDADGDSPVFEYVWRLDGEVLIGASESTLVPSDYGAKPGDGVTCEVTPGDGTDQNALVVATNVIQLVLCQIGADGLPCDDGEPCTSGDLCLAGACVGTPTVCDDQNPCTSDVCVAGAGCFNTAVVEGSDCDDSNECTIADQCVGGSCVGTAPFDCDDQNVCTSDFCTKGVGCEHAPQPGDCATGVCVEGVCCTPDCTGKVCGSDGCGGTCGACDVAETCLDPPGLCFGDLTDAMVPVKPGTFEMGCNAAVDSDCAGDEQPPHAVTLSPYYIDATEVTVGRYAECVDAAACAVPDTSQGACLWGMVGVELFPVNCVTWLDAESYCAFRQKRLCTEAEWERAARGDESLTYPWGNIPASCAFAVMQEGANAGCGLNSPSEVGSVLEAISPFGALDMAGNVSEWVADWYSPAYYLASPKQNPKGPAISSVRSHRGGGFTSLSDDVRAGSRDFLQPDTFGINVGLRCCQDYAL